MYIKTFTKHPRHALQQPRHMESHVSSSFACSRKISSLRSSVIRVRRNNSALAQPNFAKLLASDEARLGKREKPSIDPWETCVTRVEYECDY